MKIIRMIQQNLIIQFKGHKPLFFNFAEIHTKGLQKSPFFFKNNKKRKEVIANYIAIYRRITKHKIHMHKK